MDTLPIENGTLDLVKLGFHKLLSTGKLTKKIHIKVPTATASAIEKVKNAGGTVSITEKE